MDKAIKLCLFDRIVKMDCNNFQTNNTLDRSTSDKKTYTQDGFLQ